MKSPFKLFGKKKVKGRSENRNSSSEREDDDPSTGKTSADRLPTAPFGSKEVDITKRTTETSVEEDVQNNNGKETESPTQQQQQSGTKSLDTRTTNSTIQSTSTTASLPKSTAVSTLSNSPTVRIQQKQQQQTTTTMTMSKEESLIRVMEDDPQVVKAYNAVPVLEQTKLPRGGVSVETKAVGRVQFGIPPETIKDSMRLGIPVPQVYIVPVERFCREMGPALGVNLAEFEFPAYFNFFVYKKRCSLIVDSEDAEENIRRVFSETLLGPAQFRREKDPLPYEEEDFDPDFPREAIPDFQKELKNFRIMPDGTELVIETLLNFCHFECRSDGHENLGVPRPLTEEEKAVTPDLAKGEEEASRASSLDDQEVEAEELPKDLEGVEDREEKKGTWTYSQARFMGDVSVVWPFEATEEQKKNRSVPRVEVFKMPGGTEYIVHDIDANNHIIGKARFSGHVKVSESMSVDGFGGHSILDDVVPKEGKDGRQKDEKLEDESERSHNLGSLVKAEPPPSFNPPSFGVTVLGNSHGFDKSGSVSGYVLWINGRGVMIDPPPYSSATLEREGIRPRTIVGIILTHCHADHDAGAFQKVLTGSPVVVITTPTIYKSFIRKYAALSALSPALLRHSHRYKAAIIGQPLRFQGATFHFTYTLHSIPCVGFRVEWRGRSMVFTGDHLNSPPEIDRLQEKGVLSKARADDLRNLPLQETDLLLHEAGAPPLHTQLHVLLDLPARVKKRLFVVHTSALPEGCELKVAPTGTDGTIRLDQTHAGVPSDPSLSPRISRDNVSSSALGGDEFVWNGHSEYETKGEGSSGNIVPAADPRLMISSFAHMEIPLSPKKNPKHPRSNSVYNSGGTSIPPPLVSLRPASSTDAWFILNLLSAVPFLSTLSYSSTMEVLETARVNAYSNHGIIVPAARRSQVLCVVWEGTCSERRSIKSLPPAGSKALLTIDEEENESRAVWYAGDWTGPLSLQPERRLSGESSSSSEFDVVAVSTVGVKVITIEFSSLHRILKVGSPLYRKYLERVSNQEQVKRDSKSLPARSNDAERLLNKAVRDLNVLELLNCNSALRKLNAVQKRHLESLAEGPIFFKSGERLWRAGAPVDKAFLVVSGTASFVPKRRNAGSATVGQIEDKDKLGDPSVSDSMHVDAMKAMKELGVKQSEQSGGEESSMSSADTNDQDKMVHFDTIFSKSGRNATMPVSDTHDYDKLSIGLQKRAEYLQKEGSVNSENMSMDEQELQDLESCDTETESQLDYTFTDESDPGARSRRGSVIRRRASRARFANKVLGRLYSRRAFTGGLVFSRGHFLGDVSKMVAGLLSSDSRSEVQDEAAPVYGFGDEKEGQHRRTESKLLESVTELVIHEQDDHHIMHSSTLTAGKDGCVVLVFPKSTLITFLDSYPGLLLSLLGTQVVV